jgi:hypothetical protein
MSSQQQSRHQTRRAPNSRAVTEAHLYDAIAAGVAPLEQEVAGLRSEFAHLREDVAAIAKRLDARPVATWMFGRFTTAVDRALPFVLGGGLLWIFTRL